MAKITNYILLLAIVLLFTDFGVLCSDNQKKKKKKKKKKTKKKNDDDETCSPSQLFSKQELKQFIDNHIEYIGQSCVRIEAQEGIYIYIDPYNVSDNDPKASMIFITHTHSDHFSRAEIDKIVKKDTVFVFPKSALKELKMEDGSQLKESESLKFIAPRQTRKFSVGEDFEITVRAIHAYNIREEVDRFVPPKNPIFGHWDEKEAREHQKRKKWLGYVLSFKPFNGEKIMKIYHTGDTNKVPEMEQVTQEKVDIMFVPLGPLYTMNNPIEASEAVELVKPRVAIPIHYGIIEGEKSKTKLFKRICKNKKLLAYLVKPRNFDYIR